MAKMAQKKQKRVNYEITCKVNFLENCEPTCLGYSGLKIKQNENKSRY